MLLEQAVDYALKDAHETSQFSPLSRGGPTLIPRSKEVRAWGEARVRAIVLFATWPCPTDTWPTVMRSCAERAGGIFFCLVDDFF